MKAISSITVGMAPPSPPAPPAPDSGPAVGSGSGSARRGWRARQGHAHIMGVWMSATLHATQVCEPLIFLCLCRIDYSGLEGGDLCSSYRRKTFSPDTCAVSAIFYHIRPSTFKLISLCLFMHIFSQKDVQKYKI